MKLLKFDKELKLALKHWDKVWVVCVASNAAKSNTTFVEKDIVLLISSKSVASRRTYTIFDGSGQLYKLGVSYVNLNCEYS